MLAVKSAGRSSSPCSSGSGSLAGARLGQHSPMVIGLVLEDQLLLGGGLVGHHSGLRSSANSGALIHDAA
jgi:hypothetical protein